MFIGMKHSRSWFSFQWYLSYLLWWYFKSLTPHINLLVDINTRNDEEHPRTPSSSRQQPTQPEDDGPLVLLDHLHHEEEGEGEGDQDEEERAKSHD